MSRKHRFLKNIDYIIKTKFKIMKQLFFTNKKTISRLFVLCMLLTSYISIAQVRWHANPDTSTNVTSFFNRFDTAQSKTTGDCNPSGTSAASVTTVVDGAYGRVWRITKPQGRQRAELARTNGSLSSGSFSHGNGEAFYYGWRWKISVDGTIAASNKVTVWQWKTDVPGGQQNYPLNMEYANGRLYLEAFGPCINTNNTLRTIWSDCSGSIGLRKTTLANVSVPENTWVDIVLRIRKGAAGENSGQSSGYGNGSVEFWLNGVKQTLGNSGAQNYTANIASSGTKANHRTNDGDFSDAHNVYPKWGSYNSNACKYKITTFYDEMRVATTLSAASPATHNPISTGGGSITGSWYRLKNAQTNRYMDGNGENVATSTSSSGNDKQFRFVKQGNFYNIDIRKTGGTGTGIMRTVASQNRLKLTNLSPRNNSDKLYDIQRLSDGKYSIKATNAGKFLQNNTSNTVTLTVNGPGGNNRAKWSFIRVGAAKNINKGKDNAVAEEIIEESSVLKAVSVYPNPVNNTFNIALNGIEKAEVTISSILGQTIYSTTTTDKNITLSKSNGFSTGIYLVKVIDEKGTRFIKKFVVK